MTHSSRTHLLTISDLAERTGVPPATLRSWESRYGFPRPVRLPGGHRRYAETDVAAVSEVLRQRTAGVALGEAVRRGSSGPVQSQSIYAELRRRHPELTPQSLSKRSLVALSHAIEDECAARAERPLLFGGFQRASFLHDSAARWADLARTAQVAVVFADLDRPPAPLSPGTVVEVALPSDAPLHREWIVVCDAPDLPAAMVAVQRPGQDGTVDSSRRFEAVWTVDPRAVRHASRLASALADDYRPGWRSDDLEQLDDEPAGASSDLLGATQLLNRMMGYLDAGRRRQ